MLTVRKGKCGPGKGTVRASPKLLITRDVKIWEMFTQEFSPYVIARELHTSIAEVESRIDACFKQMSSALHRMVEHQRAVDLERIGAIIRTHSQTALQQSIDRVKETKDGEPFLIKDYDTPMKAAYLVLAAQKEKARVLGYDVESDHKGDNINIWLNQVAPKEKNAKAPIEIEDMEFICDAEN